MMDFTRQAERSLILAVRQVYANSALLLASPCDWTQMQQEKGKILWSWLEISQPAAGYLVVLQPLGLAREITRCVRDDDAYRDDESELLQVQCQLTTLIAQRALRDLTLGQGPLTIKEPCTGSGAPDIREGHWVGLSFAITGWWGAVFLRCPSLLLTDSPSRQDETKILRPSEDETEYALPVSALEVKRRAPRPGSAIFTNSAVLGPSPTAVPLPVPDQPPAVGS